MAGTRPVNIEIYYAAAVRSMTMGPSNFFFGAVDPAGTVTTDKLPGAFWLQAVSVGVFGPHNWALVLPQVIEGTLTVLVLYRAVRGWLARRLALSRPVSWRSRRRPSRSTAATSPTR